MRKAALEPIVTPSKVLIEIAPKLFCETVEMGSSGFEVTSIAWTVDLDAPLCDGSCETSS